MTTTTKATKLTKTEIKILAEAVKEIDGDVFVTLARGKGCSGLEGVRAADALKKLIEKGLVDGFQCHQSSETYRGWSTFTTSMSARITEAGRAALAVSI